MARRTKQRAISDRHSGMQLWSPSKYLNAWDTYTQSKTQKSKDGVDPTDRNEDEQEVEVLELTNANQKRPRDEKGTGTTTYKRRDTRSDHERRLAGDYTAPADAQRISVGPPPRKNTPPMAQQTLRRKIGAGGHKTMNTLGDHRYSSGANGGHYGRQMRKLPSPQVPSLQVQPSRGSNVPSASSLRRDGFPDEGEARSKRQKLADGKSKNVSGSQVIDLIEEDSQCNGNFGDVVEYKGRKVSTSGSSDSKSQLPPFESPELVNFNKMTAMESTKKPRRRSKDGRIPGSSQASGRNTPAEQLSRAGTAEQAPKSTVVVVLDDSQETAGALRHGRSQDSARQQPSLPHSYNIGNGYSPRPDHIGEADHIQAAQMLQRESQRYHQNDRRTGQTQHCGAQQRLSEQRQQQRQHRRTIEQQSPERWSVSHFELPADEKRPSPRLNETFQRMEEPVQRTKATNRMKTTADTVPRKVSPISDEDELNGETTVRSQPSRSTSPQKREVVAVNGNKSAPTATSRGVSPSNLPRTQFTRQRSPQKKLSKAQSRRGSEEAGDDPVRIPIRAIYCSSCVKEVDDDDQLDLVWQQESRGFEIEFQGIFQKVPHRPQLICIGSGEATSWTEGRAEASTIVHIRGPRTVNSFGSILIVFEDAKGLTDCFQLLQYATKDNLRIQYEHAERMKKIANLQSKETFKEYKKLCERGAARAEVDALAQSRDDHATAELALMRSRKNPRLPQSTADNEEIKYEQDEESEPQSSVRKRKQNSAVTRTGMSSETVSRFFPEPRRSSRQSKPARQKTPTPPPPKRWTQENHLDPWSHSVVYPAEGKRRVTVDFQDLERLDEGEFLNDNVISFALRRIEENMAAEHKESVHFFNTFFYSALTTKNGKKALNYDAVKRWTKDKDLFNYPYTVVPINIDLHWFVAIICNLPNLSRKPASLEVDDEDEGAEKKTEALSNMEGDLTTAADGDTVEVDAVNAKKMRELSLSDDERTPDTADIGQPKEANLSTPTIESRNTTSSRPSTANKKSKRKALYRPIQYDPETPSIITLDSFGSSHTTEIRFLKEYVQAEAEAKRGMEVDTKDLQGMTAKGVPEQTNFCDCGVYLVGYIEQFAQDPRKFVTKVLTKQLDKEADFATFDASGKRAEIRDQFLALQKDQEIERKSKKSAKKAAEKATTGISNAKPASVKDQVVRHTTPTPAQAPSEAAARVQEDPAPENPVGQEQESEKAQPVPESEELEVEVPRAFDDHQALTSATAAPSRSDDGDEMLDTADRAVAEGYRSPPLVEGLLSKIYEDGPLEGQQEDGPLTAHHEKTSSESEDRPEEYTTRSADTARQRAIPDDIQMASEIGPMDGSDERPFEVPDSQEEVRSYVPQSAWSGQRTMFT